MITSHIDRIISSHNSFLDVSPKTLNIRGKVYYHSSLLQEVFKTISINSILEDITFFPYYVCDYGILDIYDYSLAIKIRDLPDDSDKILLKISQKSKLEEIDEKTKEMILNTCIELCMSDDKAFVASVNKYFLYMKEITSELMKCSLLRGRGAIYYSML